MHVVVLVPGIMGSRLALNGAELWPPTPREAVFGYGRVDELMKAGVVATDVIRNVACVDIYSSLIDRLEAWGFAETSAGGTRGRLVCWPYDWRIDIRASAVAFSAALRNLVGEVGPGARISLLAHSMGGLVARYAMEVADAALGDTAWRARIGLLATLGTPHRGAPVALVRALGQEGSTGVSGADIRKFSSDPRYPSVYQLLPPRSANAFWSTGGSPASLATADMLDEAVAGALGLTLSNVAAARALHAALDGGTRPGCRYFNFVGRTLETVVRCNLPSSTAATGVAFANGGDGTVPVWSGTQADTQFDLEGDEHSHTFSDANVQATVGALLGVPVAIVMQMAAPSSPLQLRLPTQVFAAGSTTRVTATARGASNAPLEIVIQSTDEAGVAAEPPVAVVPVATTPPAGDLTAIVELTMPARPGWYVAILRTAPKDATAPRISSPGARFATQRAKAPP